jgi:hypothetical protein
LIVPALLNSLLHDASLQEKTVMPNDLTPEEKTAQLQKEVNLLTQQLALLKAQSALDSAKQTQDALSAKAMLDALKDQAMSQSALGVAQSQLPFAELHNQSHGVRSCINTFPSLSSTLVCCDNLNS